MDFGDALLHGLVAANPVAVRRKMRQHVAGRKGKDLVPAWTSVPRAQSGRLSGSGDFVSSSNTRSTRVIGNSLSVPLFTGGYRDAKAGTL